MRNYLYNFFKFKVWKGLKVISSQNNTDSEDDADNGEFGVGAVKHKNPDYKFGKIKYPKAQS